MTADVSINLFSGRPNPRWRIPEPLATQFRDLVLGLPRAPLPAIDHQPDPLRRPGGGYRGLEVTFTDQSGTLSVVLFGGLVLQLRPKILRLDSGSPSLAERIYQSAPAGVMTICAGLPLIKLAAGGPPKLITGIQGGDGAVRCDGFPAFPSTTNRWFDSQLQTLNNCYNYANNVLNEDEILGAAIPGPTDNTNITRLSLKKALIKDTLIPLGKSLPDGCPEAGSAIVCIVLRHHDLGDIRDFHCLRLDLSGKWSHKDGKDPVTKFDNSDPGALITDIRTAKLVWNPKLVGFYLAASDKSKIK